MFHCGRLSAFLICSLGFAIVCFPATAAQDAAGDSSKAPQQGTAGRSAEKEKPQKDYSQEPFVIERTETRERFERDGTSERKLLVRVRVQSDEGAARFREILFPYDSAHESASVEYATITKPGSSPASALGPEAVKDETSAIARDAAAYSRCKEIHLTVSSIGPGDTLEYRVVIRDTKPQAPGQFWFEYTFDKNAIVLDQRVELSIPKGQPFSVRSPGFVQIAGKESATSSGAAARNDFAFTRAEEDGRTILRWKHANLSVASQDEQQPAEERAGRPDIQLSSFASWEAVAHWYSQTRSEKSALPEVRVKSEEIVRGATSDSEKIHALYDYVSKNIRYVDLTSSPTSLVARTPEEILKDGYGDSADKEALLAAMLGAAGIRAETVLIPSARKVDRALPSPAQFDRVITAIPENGNVIWLDPASDVAPFRFLPASLRNKSALLVDSAGAGKMVQTPADPPFASAQNVALDCRLSDLGKLSGAIHYSLRGDTEFVLRTAFRRTPKEQWNQLAQTILTLDGLHGDVAGVTTSDPLDTDKPFELNVQFSLVNALAWPTAKAKIGLPLLTIGLPDPPSKSTQPVELGSPLEVTTRLKLAFPPSFNVQPPVGVTVARDYAEFKSSYRFENGTLMAERSLNFKMRELPPSRTSDYLAFAHAVESDEGQSLLVENPSANGTLVPASATADDVFDTGAADLKSGNVNAAILLLQRATQMQPAHKQAWSDLGLAYLRIGKPEDGIAAFRKQLEVNPADEQANDYLGLALEQMQRTDEAALAFRKQVELNPLDRVAHAALGGILIDKHEYSAAVPELEKAAILSPDNPALLVSLGRAYLNTGDKTKALDSFQKAVDLSPTPPVWNDVAFNLAEAGIELDKAQRYAESAIAQTGTELQKISLAHVTASDLAQAEEIGDYWDTLGWIYFEKGDFPKAGDYVRAAWSLNQRGEVGDHLAQIYEKSGEKERAIHMYALALAAASPVPETRARLTLLLGGNAQIDDLVSKAKPELATLRTFEIKHSSDGDGSAQFLVQMAPAGSVNGSRIEEVRFLSGSENLRTASELLKTLDYGPVFPAGSQLKLLRRGTLACSSASAGCRFTLALPSGPGAN